MSNSVGFYSCKNSKQNNTESFEITPSLKSTDSKTTSQGFSTFIENDPLLSVRVDKTVSFGGFEIEQSHQKPTVHCNITEIKNIYNIQAN